jgi:nucleoside-diphosphate-sugar epimerase
MKKILITGGAGYIGSILATKLVDLGHQVTVVDLLKYSSSSLNHLYSFKNFNFIHGDVQDGNLMKKMISKNEYIIPLAGLVGAPLCEKYKKEAINVNYKAIKDCVKYSKNKKIIFLMSNSGYGVGEKNKFCTEDSPLNPISLYGKTKCDAEKEVIKAKNYVCFRLATVFGFSYRMRSDVMVNNFVFNALKDKKLKLFEPHFRRNFIHVRDVVDCILYTINNFKKMQNNIYNAGINSANITKLQLAQQIKKQIKDLKLSTIKGIKDPDQRNYFVSNDKLKKKGFTAKRNLNEGIKELIKGFKVDGLKIKNNY